MALENLKRKMQGLKDEIDDLHTQLTQKDEAVKAANEEKDKLELDLAGLRRQHVLLDKKYEDTEGRLSDVLSKLADVEKIADESERMRVGMEHRSVNDDSKIEKLEDTLKETKNACNIAEGKYEEISKKLLRTEAELEKAEKRAECSEKKLENLETEMHVVTSSMKSLQINEQKAGDREETFEDKIREMTKQLSETEIRAEQAEREANKKQKELQQAEDTLSSWKNKYNALKADMDIMLNDVNDI